MRQHFVSVVRAAFDFEFRCRRRSYLYVGMNAARLDISRVGGSLSEPGGMADGGIPIHPLVVTGTWSR